MPRHHSHPVVALATASATLLASELSHAGLESIDVIEVGAIGGANVYQVFVTFNEPDDCLHGIYGHTTLEGSQAGVVQNDLLGSWLPGANVFPGLVAGDTFVTIDGQTGPASHTFLHEWEGGADTPDIPDGAGWEHYQPSNVTPIGTPLTRLLMQVALTPGSSGWSGQFRVSWAEDGITPPATDGGLWIYSIFVPAPASVMLLACAALPHRRRLKDRGPRQTFVET